MSKKESNKGFFSSTGKFRYLIGRSEHQAGIFFVEFGRGFVEGLLRLHGFSTPLFPGREVFEEELLLPVVLASRIRVVLGEDLPPFVGLRDFPAVDEFGQLHQGTDGFVDRGVGGARFESDSVDLDFTDLQLTDRDFRSVEIAFHNYSN